MKNVPELNPGHIEQLNEEIFFRSIALLLGTLWREVPMPVVFSQDKVKNLHAKLGIFLNEQEEDRFYQTLDWLKYEGYLRASHDYLTRSADGCLFLNHGIPVFITEKGVSRLMKNDPEIKNKFGDFFKNFCFGALNKATDIAISLVVTRFLNSLL